MSAPCTQHYPDCRCRQIRRELGLEPELPDLRPVIVVAFSFRQARNWIWGNLPLGVTGIPATGWEKFRGLRPRDFRVAFVPGWKDRRDARDLERHFRGFDRFPREPEKT